MALEDTVKKVIQVDVSSAVTSMNNLKSATKDTGQSFNSLKEYKNYIEKLKASLLDLNEESDDYKRIVNDIKNAQEKLNKTMKATDGTIQDAEGSYNALSKQMQRLKKEFKETADEGRRMELAKQISGINDKLKDMDASIGVYSRNVGNYQAAFTASLRDLGDGIDALIPGAKKAFEWVDKIFKGVSGGGGIAAQFKEIFNFKMSGNFGKQAAEVDVNTKSLEKLTKTTRNWQAAETATQGVQAATIKNTKDIASATQKVVSITEEEREAAAKLTEAKRILTEQEFRLNEMKNKSMNPTLIKWQENTVNLLKENTKAYQEEYDAIINSNKAKEESIGLLSKLSSAWKGMSTAAKVGLGAAVAAFAALVAVAVHFIKKTVEARKALLELNTELQAGASGAAEQRVAIETLAKKYGELGDSATKKKKFLEDYKDEIEKTGVAVNSVVDADNLFINNTANYIKALENRARAQAAENLAIKKYQEYYEKIAELQAKQAEAPEERMTQQIGTSTYGAVYAIDTRKTKADIQKDIDELTAKTQKEMDIIYKFAEDSQRAVGNLLGTISKETNIELPLNIDIPEEKIEDFKLKLEDTLGEALKIWGRTQLFDLSDTEKQLLQLQFVYNKEKKMLEENGLETVKLTEEYEQAKSDVIAKGVDERLKKLDEEAALRIFLNEKVKQNEFKRVEETLRINDELLNSKKNELENAIMDDNLMIEEKERLKNELARVNAQITANNQAMVDNNKKKAKEWIGAYQDLSSSLGSIFGAIADIYMENAEYNENMTKEEEEQARNNFETAKAYQQGQVWITGLAGMVGALAAPFLSPADTILPFSAKVALGAVESAAILATTIAQSIQIANTQFGSGGGSSSGSGETVATVEAQSYSPQYTQNVTGQSDYVELSNAINEGQSDTRVYILQSDLEASSKQVKTRIEETSF